MIQDADEISVCIVCVPEVISACNRLVREQKIDTAQYKWIKKEFLLDVGEFTVIDCTNEVIGTSIRCLEKGALRSLDALHIASAMEYQCDVFATGDARQKKIAVTMGLKVEMV